jgi:hypothetical protein
MERAKPHEWANTLKGLADVGCSAEQLGAVPISAATAMSAFVLQGNASGQEIVSTLSGLGKLGAAEAAAALLPHLNSHTRVLNQGKQVQRGQPTNMAVVVGGLPQEHAANLLHYSSLLLPLLQPKSAAHTSAQWLWDQAVANLEGKAVGGELNNPKTLAVCASAHKEMQRYSPPVFRAALAWAQAWISAQKRGSAWAQQGTYAATMLYACAWLLPEAEAAGPEQRRVLQSMAAQLQQARAVLGGLQPEHLSVMDQQDTYNLLWAWAALLPPAPAAPDQQLDSAGSTLLQACVQCWQQDSRAVLLLDLRQLHTAVMKARERGLALNSKVVPRSLLDAARLAWVRGIERRA